jgi:hypothetical protein
MFAGSEMPIISLKAELAPHATLSMWLDITETITEIPTLKFFIA